LERLDGNSKIDFDIHMVCRAYIAANSSDCHWWTRQSTPVQHWRRVTVHWHRATHHWRRAAYASVKHEFGWKSSAWDDIQFGYIESKGYDLSSSGGWTMESFHGSVRKCWEQQRWPSFQSFSLEFIARGS
jgi:hypothetical protein